jgi:hypothetical protein
MTMRCDQCGVLTVTADRDRGQSVVTADRGRGLRGGGDVTAVTAMTA